MIKTNLIDDIFLIDENMLYETSIKIIGVGGGGGNAANHMYRNGINGVDFIVCNTDIQALNDSPVAKKIQLGRTLTEGWGAGNKPEIGRLAAEENLDDIRAIIDDKTEMVFLTVGMGGGTGTGASPVIAQLLNEMNILTVAIVTLPFQYEGVNRYNIAVDGISNLQKYVDALIVIDSEKLRSMHGNLPHSKALAKADDVQNTAAKCIAEIITVKGYLNVEFSDIETILKNSGLAIMGSATASGENRAERAINKALESPLLLEEYKIKGAKNVLLNIIAGEKFPMSEVDIITEIIRRKVGAKVEITWGNGFDKKLKDTISVTLIATGFEANKNSKILSYKGRNYKPQKSNFVFEIINRHKVEKKPEEQVGLSNSSENTKVKKAFDWVQEKFNFFDDDDKDPEMY